MASILRATVARVGASAFLPKATVVQVARRAALQLPTQTVLRNMSVRAQSNIANLLQRELTEEKANCVKSRELSDLQASVEKLFTITDTPGSTVISLEREFNGEKIKVLFDAMSIADNAADDEEGLDEEEEEEESDPIPDVSVEVSIEKDGKTMVMDGYASDQLMLSQVRFDEDVEDSYEGPYFQTLEEDVQEEFFNYLAERGIDDELAAFISMYSELKEQQEYVTFLDKASKFVS